MLKITVLNSPFDLSQPLLPLLRLVFRERPGLLPPLLKFAMVKGFAIMRRKAAADIFRVSNKSIILFRKSRAVLFAECRMVDLQDPAVKPSLGNAFPNNNPVSSSTGLVFAHHPAPDWNETEKEEQML